MLSNILNIKGATALSRKQQKSVLGGVSTGCGVKVDGIWYEMPDSNGDGLTRPEAEGSMWTEVNYQVSGIVVEGTVSGWCCDSCPWNSPQ
ncbi:MAG: hypothetical protein VYB44_18205 [Bacteroidota bacterium]|nr:hypothetical protein [Bacteroidota bacterium]